VNQKPARTGVIVLKQLLIFIPRSVLNQTARKTGVDTKARTFSVYTALLVYVLLRFQGFLSAWAHSFTLLFAVVRSAVRERLDLLALLRSYGRASGRIRFIGALHEAWQRLWLSGMASPAGQNTASTA
jgi:hypothetical protein